MNNRRKLTKATLPARAMAAGGRVNDLTPRAQQDSATSGAPVAMPAAYAAAWGNGLFAPGAPVAPLRDVDERARVFDYQAGINLYFTPRGGYGLLPFGTLRQFADLCEEVRIVIEAIKREIRALEWDVVPADAEDSSTNYQAEIQRLRAFWRAPDGVTEFDTWCNMLLEDLLVCDAPSLWLDMAGARVHAVTVLDGTLIRPLLDESGRIPLPPMPGYMQYIKGRNWQWFTADRLLYRPYNASSNSPYGKSPTEFMILRVNEAIRRKLSNMQYWDQTNIPEAIVGLPDNWNTQQIEEFQDYWDALLVGDIDRLRRMKFAPVKGGTFPVYEFRRPADTTVWDEWMLKVACWTFGFLPSELGLVNGAGLGGKGFLEGQENAQYRFGLGPLIQYLQNLFTGITQRMTNQPLAWRFINIGPQEDQAAEFALQQQKMFSGVIDLNVLRQAEGQAPLPNVKPFIVLGGTQVILLEDLFNPRPAAQPVGEVNEDTSQEGAGNAGIEAAPEPEEDQAGNAAFKMALSQWREKVKRRMADGKAAACDPPQLSKALLPDDLVGTIRAQIAAATDDPLEVFEPFLAKAGGPKHATQERDEMEARLSRSLADTLSELSSEYEDPQALIDADDAFWVAFAERVGVTLLPGVTDATLIGIAEVPRNIGVVVDWNVVNNSAVQWARDHAADLVTNLCQNTIADIRTTVADWVEQGGALKDLRRSIDAIINDESRAQLIAQTESTRAFAEGNTMAWKAQGIEARKWFTVRDERVCPVCGGLHGQVARMNEAFQAKAGPIQNPPAHPGCRCYVQPVTEVR